MAMDRTERTQQMAMMVGYCDSSLIWGLALTTQPILTAVLLKCCGVLSSLVVGGKLRVAP